MPSLFRVYEAMPRPVSSVAPLFVGMAVVESAAGEIHPVHRHHGEFELIVPLAQRYRCRLNGIMLELAPGSCLVVKSGDEHEDHLRAHSRHAGLWFRLGLANEHANRSTLPLFADTVAPEQQVIACDVRAEVDGLFSEFAQSDALTVRLHDARFAILFWRLVRSIDPAVLAAGINGPAVGSNLPGRLRLALARLSSANAKPADLGHAVGLGERALRSACRLHLGVSPARALMDRRLDHAADLLRSSGLNVAQVAQRLGFANPYHFARVFRQRHGRAPSAARRPG